MINQQLLDYIKLRVQQGVSKEEIKKSLMMNGWTNGDVDEGFTAINTTVLPQQPSTVSTQSSNRIWRTIVAVLIAAVILGGGAYFTSPALFKLGETSKKINEIADQLPTNKPVETVTSPEQPTEQTKSENPEIIFADNLGSCTKHKITFKHLLTGDLLEKEVLGIFNGKCDYIEQMPNGGKMECKYSESERVAVAQYYKDVASAESVGTSVQINADGQKTKYTINGKEVENPLAEMINSGTCIISGY